MKNAASEKAFNPAYWVWGRDETKPRLLHAMIRVKDIDRSLRFYVDGFGMKELNRFDLPARRVTAIFIGYGDYSDSALLELTSYWDENGPYTHGTGYGHVAIGVPDILATIARLEDMGTEVVERPRDIAGGGPLVGFVKDPDGYSVELIQIHRR